MTGVASFILRHVGHPTDSWLAAERCRAVAEATGDPVLIAYAAFARVTATRACGSLTHCQSIAEQAADDLRPGLGRPGAMDMFGMLHLIRAASRCTSPTGPATSPAPSPAAPSGTCPPIHSYAA